MKNIHTLLSDIGVTVPEDKKTEFDKAVLENYKTVADYNKKSDKVTKLEGDLETANGKITELGEAVKGTEGADETIRDLTAKLEAYQQSENERKEAEKNAQIDAQLTTTIDDYFASDDMKDKKFVNEFTRNSIVENLKAELNKSENKGKGVGDLFNAITKDQEGIFKNPQAPLNIPGVGNFNPGETDPNKMTYEQYKAWRNPAQE